VTTPIRRQLVVPGDAQLAFRVFTDEIGTWWPVGTGHSVYGAGSGVVLRDRAIVEIGPDGQEAVWGTIVDWEPPHRFRMTWHPGRTDDVVTEVTVSFADVAGGQTLVTLEHDGWERLADPAAARAGYREGWPFVLSFFRGACEPASSAGVGAFAAGGPVEGEAWVVLRHEAGPALAPGERAVEHPDFAHHFAFLRTLDEAGLLVAAGPLDSASGMTVVRLPTAAQLPELVRRAQDEDQSVARGLLDVRVVPWRVGLVGSPAPGSADPVGVPVG